MGLTVSVRAPMQASKQARLGGSVKSVPHRRLHATWRKHAGLPSHTANSSQQHELHAVLPNKGPHVCPSEAVTTDDGHDAPHVEATQ
jgi:hypothetical protein